jgi:hypothetical protein
MSPVRPCPAPLGPARLAVLAGPILGLVLGLAQAAPVAAASPAGPPGAVQPATLVGRLAVVSDPDVAFRNLTPADQRAVAGYLSASRIASNQQLVRRPAPQPAASRSPMAPARTTAAGPALAASALPGAGCWTWKWERAAYNLLGLKLWAYDQEIDWCDDGSVMLGTPQVLNFGVTYFPFWSWVHAGDRTWGGAGQSTFRAWTQADFSLCLTPNIGCIQNTYPWLDMTAHANGTGSGSAG